MEGEAAEAGAEAGAEGCGYSTVCWMKTTSHQKGGDGEEARYRGAEAAGANGEEEEEEEGAKH